MPKRWRVLEQWIAFQRALLPLDVGDIQRKEMRRAFYAGAEGMMRCVVGELSPGDEVTDADVAVMEDIHAELRDFADRVKAGRA